MSEVLISTGVLASIGAVAGLVLVFISKALSVKEDENKLLILEVLPGVNCGACGFAGCDEYAQQLSDGLKEINRCTPGGDDVAKKISKVLQLPFESVTAKIASVHCQGHLDTSDYIMDYIGPQSCNICNRFYNGRTSCSHACLGYGDCVKECKYDAISIVNNVAIIDSNKCTGCSLCASACPNHLITINDSSSRIFVACSSHDKGAFTRKLCKHGCIGCGRCVKVCPSEAIVMDSNLACIVPERCTNCKQCIDVCPTHAIHNV